MQRMLKSLGGGEGRTWAGGGRFSPKALEGGTSTPASLHSSLSTHPAGSRQLSCMEWCLRSRLATDMAPAGDVAQGVW